jgi:hypothetical protein
MFDPRPEIRIPTRPRPDPVIKHSTIAGFDGADPVVPLALGIEVFLEHPGLFRIHHGDHPDTHVERPGHL